MNRKILIVCFFILITLIITGIVLNNKLDEKNNNEHKIYNEIQEINVIETNEIGINEVDTNVIGTNEVVIDKIEINEIENMEDLKLADLFYEFPKVMKDFVKEDEENYEFSNKSVDKLEDAIENAKKGISNEELKELRLEKETEYYYAIYKERNYYNIIGELISKKNSYIYFKSSVLDIENESVNINIINSKDKIKEIFNLYMFLRTKNTSGTKILESNVQETENQYLYSYIYFRNTHGDYGVSDTIRLCKTSISINKTNGKYENVNEEVIRTVKGYYNDVTITQ